MFNLIISIIAIALVVVLAGASLYYGGEAFNKGSEDAKASTYVNQAQQIQAAATLYKATTGGDAADVASLISGKYMAGVPKIAVGTDGAWEIKASAADPKQKVVSVTQKVSTSAKDGMTLNICDTINDNGSGVVSCTDKDGKIIDLDTPAISGSVSSVEANGSVTISMKL